LIADEVAVGFGRTGTLFACAQEGVTPDFLCLAKGLTGGYLPLAATLTTDRVFDAFLGPPEAGRTFYHGHTYTGNPLGCAVALANLDLLTAPDGLPALGPKIERFRRHLERLWEIPVVGDVRQRGLMAGVELVRDRRTREPFPPAARMGQRVCRLMRDRGVILRPLGDVVVVMPPLAIDENLLDRLMGHLYDSLREVAGE
jgi:adenosylmethionine-8-amino-7-oxononanoate aminotransferase